MKKTIAFVLTALLCCLYFGCAPSYKVNIDGVTAGHNLTAAANCVILPAGPHFTNDLTFNEYKAYVADALTQKGYNVVGSKAQARTVILMSYGVGNPLEKIRNTPSASIGFGTGYWGWGNHWGWGFMPSFYFPLNDIDSYTTYGSYLHLLAYDISQEAQMDRTQYLWQINVALRSSSSDLRTMMPVLVAAAMPYMGDDTGRQITVDISMDDAYVQHLQSLKPAGRNLQRTDYTAPQ